MTEKIRNLSATATATVRSGWFIGVLTALVGFANKWFGWDLTVEQLLPYAPIAAVVGGAVYRAARALGDRYPIIGTILFGINKAPAAYAPTR